MSLLRLLRPTLPILTPEVQLADFFAGQNHRGAEFGVGALTIRSLACKNPPQIKI
jgi:hypothetical protein